MAKYISGKVKDLNIGISDYSENKPSVTVIGNVGIGTLVPTDEVGSGNTAVLAAGIVSAYQFYGDGSNITGVGATDKVVTESLDVLGISTLRGTLSVAGVATFTSAIDANGDLDVDGHTELDDVNIAGVATANNFVGISGSLTNFIVTGIGTFSDNVKLNFGGSNDLQIYHATSGGGSTSYIDNNTGPLYIRNNVDDDDGGNIIIEAKSGKASAVFQDDEGVRLYFNDAEKFATLSTGATVTGDLYATTFYGDGSNLAGVVTNTGIDTTGISDFSTLNVSTLLDVDGHTELDDVNVVGFSTFTGNITANGPTNTFKNLLQVDGHTTLGIGETNNIDPRGQFVRALIPSGSSGDQSLGRGDKRWNVFGQDVSVAGVSTFTSDSIFLSNVGIGTTNPVRNLHIHEPSTGNAYLHLTNDTTGGTTEDGFSLYVQSDGTTYYRARESTGRHLWTTANTETMRLTADGDLGIGTDDPTLPVGAGVTSKLSVGIVSAYQFYGDGSNLTNITADSVGDLASLNVTGLSTFVGDAQFDSNVSIAGTLTYEDVTNIDSLGIVTAGQGFRATAGGLIVSGVSTFNDDIKGDTATNISGINSVTATTYYGDGSNLSGTGFTPDADQNLVAGGQSPGANLDGTNACFNNLIGAGAGHCITSGKGNVALGKWAAYYTKTGEYNSYFNYAGSNRESGNYNVAIGLYTLKGSETAADNTGSYNIALGKDAGCRITSGSDNIALGQLALGSGPVTGGCNIAFGANSGKDITSGEHNILLGCCAGKSIAAGGCNIVIGMNAGCAMIPDSNVDDNIAIGRYAGAFLDGSTNVIIGKEALVGNASYAGVSHNIAIGCASLQNTRGMHNVALGRDAGICMLLGNYNVLLGGGSGYKITTGCCNTMVGRLAGCNATTGHYNVALGHGALVPIVDGSNQLVIGVGSNLGWINGDSNMNVGIGTTIPTAAVGVGNTAKLSVGIVSAYQLYGDGQYLTGVGFSPDADENLVAGTNAGEDLDGSSGCYNILLGQSAGKEMTSGEDNIALGQLALGEGVVTGSNNIALGKCSAASLTSSQYSTIIGAFAGKLLTNVTDNTLIGASAGMCLIGQANSVLGKNALGNMCSSNYNVAIGNAALYGSSTYADNTAGCNVAIGLCAGSGLKSGGLNVFLGKYAGKTVTTGSNNIALGELAMGSGTVTGNNNIALGCCAGKSITSGDNNVFLGQGAGCAASGASYNVAIGKGAGRLALSGENHVFVGCYAGLCAAGGSNTLLGGNAGRWITSGSSNVAVGSNALRGEGTGGNGPGGYNAAVGAAAGRELNGGKYNSFFGHKAGCGVSSGCCNVIIGHLAQPPSLSGDNQLVIGSGANNWIVGNANFNVGIGTTRPDDAVGAGVTAKLSVGILSAYQLYGDGSELTGITTAGGSPTAWTPDADENLVAGTNAGADLDGTNACYNLLLGFCAGKSITSGSYSIALGYQSMDLCAVTADCNIAIGKGTGRCITSGFNNIFMGNTAGGLGVITGGNNTAIGFGAGRSLTSGSENIFLGRNSALNHTSGSSNFFGGYKAGRCRETGSHNIALGEEALRGGSPADVNTGSCNIALGICAGLKLTTGCNNILLGKNVACELTTGSENVFIGCDVGAGVTSGLRNIGLGYAAMDLCEGDSCRNIAIGYAVGRRIKDTVDNVFIGSNVACTGELTGDDNVAIGEGAFKNATSGCRNVYMGYRPGYCNETGSYNIGLGYNVLEKATNCTQNIAIGAQAGNNLTGSLNIILGSCAMRSTGVSSYNIALGAQAMRNAGCSCRNIFLGYKAACSLVSNSCDNVFLGCYAGIGITQTSGSVIIGVGVSVPINEGDNQLAIGVGHTHWITGNADFNVGIGTTNPNAAVGAGNTAKLSVGIVSAYQLYGDGQYLTGTGGGEWQPTTGAQGNGNLYAGTLAGNNSDSDTCFNIAIGCAAGCSLNSGDENILLGKGTGEEITNGDYNIAFGNNALEKGSSGDYNIAAGRHAGKNVGSGSNNIFLGCNAGCESYGQNNIFIGQGAGKLFTGGNWNTVIGLNAASSMTLIGGQNVFLGMEAGCTQTTTCWSVAIGQGARLPITDGNRQLSIGCYSKSWIVGDCDFNVGIGTTIPTAAVGSGNTAVLAVGIVSAYQLYGDGSNLTGVGGDTFWVSNSTGIHTTSNIGIGTTNASNATVNIEVGTATTALVVQGSAGQLFSVTNSLSSGSIFSVNDISGIPSIDVDADGTIQLAPYGTGEMVGVGTTSPTSKLHVIGGALITGVVTATDVDSTSDIRLKTNIQPIDNPLAKVIQIEGVSFNWKQDNRPALGVIADQVEKILPQLVHGDDPKTVNYNGLIGLLIEAVKEQQSEIDTLKERISKLE